MNGSSETARSHFEWHSCFLICEVPPFLERDSAESEAGFWVPLALAIQHQQILFLPLQWNLPNKWRGSSSKRSCQSPGKSTINLESTQPVSPLSLITKTQLQILSFQVRKGYTKQMHDNQGAPLFADFYFFIFLLFFLDLYYLSSSFLWPAPMWSNFSSFTFSVREKPRMLKVHYWKILYFQWRALKTVLS